MSYLAPAGTAISLRQIASGAIRGVRSGDVREELPTILRLVSGLPHCWPVSSGRAAMTLILKAMKSAAADPTRDEVLIPAYTCYSVPAAIARAGLRPRLCDVDPQTLGMDPEALDRADFSRVLAIISANLYGIPNALADIEGIARRRGVYMLDDAAQALGASIGGRGAGTFGDAGLYSFDKGKVICTIQGGAIVSRDGPVAQEIEKLLSVLEYPPAAETLSNFIKLLVYSVFLQPTLYGLVRRLPFLGLGRTAYETRYLITGLSNIQTGVAIELLNSLESIASARRVNAQRIMEALAGMQGIGLPSIPTDAVPAFVRAPLLIADPALREIAIATLDQAGIGATTSYPLALVDVPEVRSQLRSQDDSFLGARQVAERIVTLPTHAYCPPDLGPRIRALLEQSIAARNGRRPVGTPMQSAHD